MDWLTSQTPLIIGHRGASAAAPENTLAAFGLAAEQGAQGIEFDVRQCADGTVVVMHDRTVARTTNGSGNVADLTIAELRALDAGLGQPVPTLDDVFQTFGPALLYNVELKDWDLRGGELALAVADRIAAYHLENQVLVSSFNPLAVRHIQPHLSRTTMTAVIWGRGPRWLWHLLGGNVAADHPHYSLVDDEYMAWAREHKYRVHVWTVDEPEEARRLARLGVHALITNKPDLISRSLDESKD